MSDLLRTPLYANHAALGAKLVPFAGWEMPVQYQGILAEHRACRGAAGLFDVSHMGEFTLTGAGSLEFLQRALTNDFGSLAIGRCRYSLMCNEAGGIVDDLIVYRTGESEYLLVVNAGNIAQDFAWLDGLGHPAVTLVDRSRDYGLLALQGPAAAAILAPLLSGADAATVAALKYYAFADVTLCGQPVTVSRTGYTGSPGYEILIAADQTALVWDTLLAAGAPAGLVPVGLGARDTLRLEAGFCLHGHDISPTRNPLEAGLERFVKLDKPEFVGRAALAAVAASGPAQRLVGVTLQDRAVAREGAAVSSGGQAVGVVTSGTFAPSLEQPIALAYVRSDLAAVGTELTVEVRGKALACRVTALPFYRP